MAGLNWWTRDGRRRPGASWSGRVAARTRAEYILWEDIKGYGSTKPDRRYACAIQCLISDSSALPLTGLRSGDRPADRALPVRWILSAKSPTLTP